MGTTMRKLDIIAVTASKTAADKLAQLLAGLKSDTAAALAGDTSIFHRGIDNEATILSANATVTADAITLVNEERAKVVAHLASTGNLGAHLVASAEAIAAPVATDLATAITLANELKADYNTHLSESGVHINNDSTNAVAAADASDEATLVTLVNEIKADYNTHIVSSMSSGYIEI